MKILYIESEEDGIYTTFNVEHISVVYVKLNVLTVCMQDGTRQSFDYANATEAVKAYQAIKLKL